MATIRNVGALPGGVVSITLYIGDGTGAKSILSQQNVTVDSTGKWQALVTGTDSPSYSKFPNPYYDIIEPTATGTPNVYTVTVPNAISGALVSSLPSVAIFVTRVPAITGSRGGNAAVASLIAALVKLGLVTDSTTA